MTLVVARITDKRDGQVSLMADTKISDYLGDESANRQVLTRPGQKVVIINNDVVVGFAGDNPEHGVREAVNARARHCRTTDLLNHLTQYSGESSTVSRCYLVAIRRPEPQLWRIANGRCEDRTDVCQAYVGDENAYDRFRSRTQQWDSATVTDEFRFVSSMQTVVNMDDLPTVGGYVVRVSGSRVTPFRFRGDPNVVGPWLTNTAVQTTAEGIRMRFSTPADGDPTVHTRIDIAGREPTFSALVHVIPQSGTAWMHTHEEPWAQPIRLVARTAAGLFSEASEYGQHLEVPQGVIEDLLNGTVPGL
ncbi:hypothetical protein [Gordonia sp. 1D]|uniref:hypothetical protein n=1 Tax=Gordonia sp. 1D TaxID=1737359 RepID=UPI0012FE4120|nr:hypothetical protein [Gordonia sp. 1D]